MGDIRIAGHDYFLAAGPQGDLTNSWREEDASPTAVQSAENAPDAANVPVAATEYTNWQGSLGLYERDQQPNDFSRWFVADWDSSRPMQVSSWVRWPGDTVALTGGGAGANTATGSSFPSLRSLAIVEDSQKPGFVVSDTVSGSNGSCYYCWNGTSFALTRTNVSPNGVGYVGEQVSNLPLWASPYLAPPPQIVWPTQSTAWLYTANNTMLDLNSGTINSTIPAGIAVPFYDFVVVFSYSGAAQIDITAYKPPWTNLQNAQLPTSTVATTVYSASNVTANVVGSIQGERAVAGVVACEGVMWVATDRSVYAVLYNDVNRVFETDKLFSVPRITGAPVEWLSEVYIPCEGSLAHIIPGQKGYDIKKPDQFDSMPLPFNGWITQLMPTPDALFCKVVEAQDTGLVGSTRAMVYRLDTSGSWSCVICDESTTSLLGLLPLVKMVDRTAPPAIGYFTDATHVRLLPAKSAGRNPKTLIVAQRPQAALVRGISPWETGEARANQKQLLRFRIEVEDCVGCSVTVYYRFPPDGYPGTTDTFTSGAGVGLGTFHKCAVVTASTTGYGSSAIDANGNGYIWVEFDGLTSYSGGVGVLPQYPDYTAVQWAIEIQGDTSGTHAPLVRSLEFHREEYLSKAKIISAVIELSTKIARRGRNDALPDATDTLRDAAWVQAEEDFIESIMAGKRAQTVISPKGKTFQATITKWSDTIYTMNDDGVTSAHIGLSLKVIPLLGVL